MEGMRGLWTSRRPLGAMQVEVSGRCTRACAVCPRSALRDVWCGEDLATDAWERLRPDLRLASHVHLQGWGEPLLHPRIETMVRDTRQAGCTVGITTNGDLLERATDWILDAGVDLVTLSVAGDAGTHARLRDGSRLDDVMERARKLARAGRTHVKVSYLLTREGAADLPPVVERAARAGLDGVVVNHLDTTPTPDLLARAAFTDDGLAPGVGEHLDEAERVARRGGIRLWLPARSPQHMLTCALNPLTMLFVGWDGRVGPCVDLLLPIVGAIPRETPTGRLHVRPEVWGDLGESTLAAILASDPRREFLAPFEARLDAERRFLGSCVGDFGSEALARLDRADRARSSALDGSPFPPGCEGCHLQRGF